MQGSRKLRVAVLFGGKSGEHEVSLASARSVMDAMDKDKYEIVPVGITKSGRWLASGDPMALLTAGEDVSPNRENSALAVAGGWEVARDRAHRAGFDVVFPVLHGTYGEDGTVQGLLELANLPYVGAGVLGSAVGLDKAAMKAVFVANGLPVCDYAVVLRSEWRREADAVLDRIQGQFDYPVFVKPANLGSSVGVSKAIDRESLRAGLDLAARFDRRLLVEEGLDVREIECSVLGNDDPIASVPGEVVPCNEFYDYAAKYIDDDSELCIPANLPPETAQRIRELAVQAFVAIDCAGMARADFFVCRDTGRVYVNELNTIPGFTNISMYPKLWEASGLSYPDLVDRLIELAIERYEDKQSSETSYGFDH